jgi:RNA polymerase sigma-70 factor (ECF subfamily)
MEHHERFTLHWTAAQPVVGSYIASLVPDFQEAEDLLQEVALVLLRKFSQYNPERPFVAWALGVAKFEILASRRRHARSFLTTDNDLLDNLTLTYTELAPELDQRSSALRDCLHALEGRSAELIRLRYEESLKPGQIASRVGLDPTVVRMALSRTRAALRDCIQNKLKLFETLA